MNNVNVKELAGIGMVLELGKLLEDEEKRGRFYNEIEREKEKERYLEFLRNKPWIKVQRP